jgi:hypothetical protein
MKKTFLLGCAVPVLAGAQFIQAAVLTTVPMQGGMVMPMVAYHADHGHLHVTMDPAVPQLTPLLVSNPGDSFASTDPWYYALDPNQEGRAFSRRYGFVMDSMTDALPVGTAIWIRKLSSTPGLGAYRYQTTAPKAFQPIFGTDGSTNAMQWNGMMFHPTFTAPPGTNAFTAAFEAFLVNTNAGLEVPDSGSGPFVLEWTTVPDGRPALSIGSRMVIAWPASATNCVLESADAMPSSNWTRVTNSPVMLDGQAAVILDGGAAQKFFRMSLTP